MYKKSIFWFRQDLRTYDNKGLIEAVKNSDKVLPVFILDKNIIDSFGGLKDQKFGFIREALEVVSSNLQKKGGISGVTTFFDKPENIIPKLVKKYNIEAVYTNRSYGSYGIKRDDEIKKKLDDLGCEFNLSKDFLLSEPWEIEQRKVFTPYYKLWMKSNFDTKTSFIQKFKELEIEEKSSIKDFVDLEKHPYFTLEFGENRVKNHISSNYVSYRNDLDKDGTSKLSPYLRFGIYSVRQIYNIAFEKSDSYISELAWREFWNQIYYNFPETKNIEFQEKRRHISWSRDKKLFQKWCDGETGYPVVDASMKQLNETNWMHGRARMIVASFLTKDLHIDWRLGEKYFKEKLLDYDEAVNLGNWQWCASVGADPKPLRIFNPMLQSEKFDPDASFIKKYIPELRSFSPKVIHNPIDNDLSYQKVLVDHKQEQRITRDIYKGAI